MENERPTRVSEAEREQIRVVWQIWQERCWDRKRMRIAVLAERLGLEMEEVAEVWESFV